MSFIHLTSPLPWRAGRQVHRTLYDATDRLIGLMDRPEDTALVVDATQKLVRYESALRWILENAENDEDADVAFQALEGMWKP